MDEFSGPFSSRDIEKLITFRRTIQKFLRREVDEKLVLRALELALWAPNHKMTMAIRFIMIGNEIRGRIADLSAELKLGGRDAPSAVREVYRTPWLNPASLVAVVQIKDSDPDRSREDYAFIAAGLQNAALYLASMGIGSKWSTAKLIRDSRLNDWLEVQRDREEVVGILMIGYAEEQPAPPKRPNLTSKFSRTN